MTVETDGCWTRHDGIWWNNCCKNNYNNDLVYRVRNISEVKVPVKQGHFHAANARHSLAACLAALLVALAGVLGAFIPTSAWADDVSSSVTKISTDATTYDSYSTVACTLSFSASELNSGDTITASWSPTSGAIYATGYSSSFNVTDSSTSTVIGTAVVTSSGLTVTFTDNVANYSAVSGSVAFSLEVFNTGTADGTVTIFSGDQTATITVSPNTASEDTPVYKTGEWDTDDTDYVYWAFRVNRNYSNTYTSDVTITDAIPSGLTFNKITALNVYNSGDTAYNEADDAHEISVLMDELGITVAYSSGTLTVTIPQEAASTYYIYFEFTTTVSDSSSLGSSITNTATANYSTDSSAATDHSISETLTVPSSSASADGDGIGNLSITKKVTGTAGNTSTHYTIQLFQSGLSGTYTVTYSGIDDDDTVHSSTTGTLTDTITFTDGVATLQLKDGETATISDVPTGTMAVSETDLGSSTAQLTVTAQSSADDSATTLTVSDGSTSTYLASISTGDTTSVTVTNNSDFAASTGIDDDGDWRVPLLVLLATVAAALLLMGHSIKGRGYARKE